MLWKLRTTLRSIGASGMLVGLLCSLAGLAGSISSAFAQTKTSALVEKMNANTLMMLTAGSGLTYGAFAADLATVLNDGDEFRILPVQGHSAYPDKADNPIHRLVQALAALTAAPLDAGSAWFQPRH